MVPSGTYTFGPNNGRLLVKIEREGMAKKAGHDLTLEVASWGADVTVDGDNPANSQMKVNADSRSFQVVEWHGGVKPMTEGDKKDIKKNIDEKCIKNSDISFQSTSVNPTANGARVSGDLSINGASQPAQFEIQLDGGIARCTAQIQQSLFGIKPFSAFMGALKVRDVVEIEFEGKLPS
ncbi:MAG: YceI family protein [Acidimicrobiales bacterium]